MDKEDALIQELVQHLSSTKNAAEQAAVTAEFCLDGLSEEIAPIVRMCVLFHWFDQTVIESLLQMSLEVPVETDQVYEQIRALPFVEILPWGLRFRDLTREGLLHRYTQTQPEILQQAAHLGVSAYTKRQDDKKIAAELLFCSIVAGNYDTSVQLLHSLQRWAYTRSNWQYLRNLLQIQEEAESFSFVDPLPRDEDGWILRGLVSQSKGEQKEAIASYSKAIVMNPQNAMTLVHRGTAYAEQRQLKKALADYDRALQVAPDLALAYAGRGIIFMQKGHYTSALKDIDAALQQNRKDPFLYYTRGTLLNKQGKYQEALAAFNEALQLDPYYSDAYGEKGTLLNKQGKYQEALTAFNEALQLDPYHADASAGKDTALSGLKQYEQVSLVEGKSPKSASSQTQQILLSDRTDAVLAKQVISGDQEALEFLLRRYTVPLFNFICRFLGDYDLACDVLEQVFLRFYISLPKLGAGGPFKPWLFQVARNSCVDELRRKYRSTIPSSQFENSEGDLASLHDIPDPGPLPEEVVERHDLQALLQDAIQSLPPKFRSVVILRYVSQMTFPEIGQVLSMPEATAKTYFHRAKVLLRKFLFSRLQMA